MTTDELLRDGFVVIPGIDGSTIKLDTPILATVPNGLVMIVRTTQGIVAFNPVCPHQLGNLAIGSYGNGCITCLVHDYVFNVSSGVCVEPRGEHLRLRHYPLVEHNGMLWVHVANAKWRSN